MRYSNDLRKRVLAYVASGRSKSEAARRFSISRKTVYNWLSGSLSAPGVRFRRSRKLDWNALRRDISAHPDLLLRERAAKFGVNVSSLCYACKEMGISHKKNTALP